MRRRDAFVWLIAARLYTLLLRLYPRRFRAEFADEMQAVFSAAVGVLAGLPIAYSVVHFQSPGFKSEIGLNEVIRLFFNDLFTATAKFHLHASRGVELALP
jgi:hypothetical protein